MVRPTELNFSLETLPSMRPIFHLKFLLGAFALSFENTNAGAIWATSVIPAKAGIHPLPPLDADLRRHDESGEEPCGAGEAAVSYFVDERKFMDTSW